MAEKRSEHVGATLLVEERQKLLRAYDSAIASGKDDAVKTEHGNVAESLFRQFLSNFLPLKYGVTKGYIITTDLEYDQNLEEWDIIIYNAIESPVLSIRQQNYPYDLATKRAIPIRHVRAVIEVKSTFNSERVTSAVNKLLKLNEFGTQSEPGAWGNSSILPERFYYSSVFFETKVEKPNEFKSALSAMTPLVTDLVYIPHAGSLILRGMNQEDRSSIVDFYAHKHGEPVPYPPEVEYSEVCKEYVDRDKNELDVVIASMGFGENEFWRYVLNLLDLLNGDRGPASRFRALRDEFGFKQSLTKMYPLFPRVNPIDEPSKKTSSKARRPNGKTRKKK